MQSGHRSKLRLMPEMEDHGEGTHRSPECDKGFRLFPLLTEVNIVVVNHFRAGEIWTGTAAPRGTLKIQAPNPLRMAMKSRTAGNS